MSWIYDALSQSWKPAKHSEISSSILYISEVIEPEMLNSYPMGTHTHSLIFKLVYCCLILSLKLRWAGVQGYRKSENSISYELLKMFSRIDAIPMLNIFFVLAAKFTPGTVTASMKPPSGPNFTVSWEGFASFSIFWVAFTFTFWTSWMNWLKTSASTIRKTKTVTIPPVAVAYLGFPW